MGAGDIQRVFAFEVHGLQDPTDSTSIAPVLFSTGELSGVTSLSGFTNHIVKDWVRDVSGYNWSSDPRRVVGSGGQCVAKLIDVPGTFGRRLLRNSKSQSWDVQSATVTEAATSIKVGGATAPTESQVYWLEGEAVQITSAPSLVAGSSCVWEFDIARAVCGSRALYHRLDPATYYPGEEGLEDRMFFDSRPNLQSYLFTGALYLFRLDQFGAVKDYIRRWVYIEEPPTPLKGKFWEFRFRDVGDLMATHPMGHKSREVSLSHQIQVTEFGQSGYVAGQSVDPSQETPRKVTFWMRRQEADRFFREPLHEPGLTRLNETLTTDLATSVFSSSKIFWYALVEASGKWLYALTSMEYKEQCRYGDNYLVLTPFVKVTGHLVDYEFGRGIADEDQEGLNDGWGVLPAAPIGHDKDGEAAPKLSLRVMIKTSPVEALLYLACSDSGQTSDAYDVCPGRVGLGLPSSWFNLGSTVANPLLADTGHKELLVRNQLLDEPHSYHIPLKEDRKLGEFVSADICQIHSLLFGPLQDGKLSLRPWVRRQPVSIPTLPRFDTREVEPGARLGRVRAIDLLSGFRLLTLEPQFTRQVRARDARLRNEKDKIETQTMRVWKSGNHIQVQDLATGRLSDLVRAFLDVYGGAPIVYEVPTSVAWLVDNSINFADFVSWANTDVLSYSGTGVSGVFILFGYNINWKTGEVTARLIEDTYNTTEGTVSNTGNTAPALIPIKVTAVQGASLTYDVIVEAIGDRSANLATSFGNIFGVALGGYVRVSRAGAHNPVGTTERDGHLEAYAVLSSRTYDNGEKRAKLRLAFNAAWERDGKTITRDILVPHESVISLCDRRPDGTHPQSGTDLEAPSDQMSTLSKNIAKISGPQSLDRVLHLFGA